MCERARRSNRPDRDTNVSTKMDGSRSGDGARCNIIPRWVSDTRHLEDNPAATFLLHVESLVSSISEMGNPCIDQSGDLLVLDTRVVAECTIVESVQTIEKIGKQRCDRLYQDLLLPELNI